VDAADGKPNSARLGIADTRWDPVPSSPDSFDVVFASDPAFPVADVTCQVEPAGQLIREPRAWFRKRTPAYRPLFPHVSVSGRSVIPFWVTPRGRTVIGWLGESRRRLLVGLNVVEELIRYTQGDPGKLASSADRTLWGYGNERSTFLYEDHIVPGFELVPWADQLGYAIAHLIAAGSGLPLLCPLPNGKAGGILVTGDDDQAFLEKYDEQLRLLDGFPITYLLLPTTGQTAKTLTKLPKSVELGVHIDALACPERYDTVCNEQTAAIRALTGKPIRTVRNHGHLNRDYWGHLPAWEQARLSLDLNNRGLDGTCPTGSYLPFQVRRGDGSWSSHMSLFSTFSDSMLYLQKWPQKKQIRCIRGLAGQIERSFPGVMVFNFHPQNVSDGYEVHRAVMEIGRRRDWVALGAESYAAWLLATATLRMTVRSGCVALEAPDNIHQLAVYWPSLPGSPKQLLSKWDGVIELRPPSQIVV